MNSVQYCDKVLATGFLLMYREAGGAENGYSLVEDASRVYSSADLVIVGPGSCRPALL